MRYEVIGWTNYEDKTYRELDFLGYHAKKAIIDEIRRNDYDITGYEHQNKNGVPVLNSGECVKVALSAWGYIMAEAKSPDDNDLDSLALEYGKVKKKGLKMPPIKDIDRSKIKRKKELYDTYRLDLSEDDFKAIKEGQSLSGLTIPDDFKYVDGGDCLYLACGDQKMLCAIKDFYCKAEADEATAQLVDIVSKAEELAKTWGIATISFDEILQGTHNEPSESSYLSDLSERPKDAVGAKIQHIITPTNNHEYSVLQFRVAPENQ